MLRIFYSLVFRLLLPLVLLRLWWRGRANPGYRERVAERLGLYPGPPPVQGVLWLHTVSVGEFLAARPLIDQLLQDHPEIPLLITTTTPTGSDRVKAAYSAELATGRIQHVWMPYDLPGAIRRLLRHFQPQQLVILETELWPNLIHESVRYQIPVLVVNARLSERSAAGYARVSWLSRPLLQEITVIATQTQADADRFAALGVAREQLQVCGNIKFDLPIAADLQTQAQALRAQWGPQRAVMLAASTHAGEDEQILDAWATISARIPDALLVIVPRHPERFDSVANLVQQRGLRLARHGRQEPVHAAIDVVLGDTMGELLKLLGAADVAFMGGSLVPRGGHNVLEPLLMGVPVVSGPHLFNFAVIAELLTEAGSLQLVVNATELSAAMIELLAHAELRAQRVAAGSGVIAHNRGALQRLLALIHQQLPAVPHTLSHASRRG